MVRRPFRTPGHQSLWDINTEKSNFLPPQTLSSRNEKPTQAEIITQMSYSNESLRTKLDSLQETQDSIVSTSTWVLFHYRYADRIAAEWEKYLYTAPPHRKLPVIYLANDVVQQARARKRTEFLDAFFKVLPESLGNAYKKVPPPIQQKITKIVNVLKERKIFSQDLDVPGVNASERSSAGPSGGSEDEKLRALATSGQRFHRFYHELLISSNGTFTDAQLPYLQRLKLMLRENIGQLEDLEGTVEQEIEKATERSKAAKEKMEELKRKQQELEEQRVLEEMKKQEELRKQAEEDKIIPTYAADSDSDSDSDSDEKDSDSDSDDEKLSKKRTSSGDEEEDSYNPEDTKEEPALTSKSSESTETTSTEDIKPMGSTPEPSVPVKPRKKLRFA